MSYYVIHLHHKQVKLWSFILHGGTTWPLRVQRTDSAQSLAESQSNSWGLDGFSISISNINKAMYTNAD